VRRPVVMRDATVLTCDVEAGDIFQPLRNLRYTLLFALGVVATVPASVLMPSPRSYYYYSTAEPERILMYVFEQSSVRGYIGGSA
jgi:hypothetical protein